MRSHGALDGACASARVEPDLHFLMSQALERTPRVKTRALSGISIVVYCPLNTEYERNQSRHRLYAYPLRLVRYRRLPALPTFVQIAFCWSMRWLTLKEMQHEDQFEEFEPSVTILYSNFV